MSKKFFLIALIVLGLVLIGLLGFFLIKKSSEPNFSSPVGQDNLSSEISPSVEEKLKIYNDEAGFSFQYSDRLSVEEEANQDNQTYSFLRLTDVSRPGEILLIKVVDTQFATVEKWLADNKKPDWQVNETVMAEMNGKYIVTAEKLLSVAVNRGILFLIESPVDQAGYWQKAQKTIRESFKVNWPAPESVSSSLDSGIEEIIE